MISRLKNIFAPKPAAGWLTIDDLRDRLTGDLPPLVLDVRSKEEFGFHGHIAGAMLLPEHELPHRAAELPADRAIVCVCRTDRRSERAAQWLLSQGYETVMVLEGGMLAWKNAGLPVERHALK